MLHPSPNQQEHPDPRPQMAMLDQDSSTIVHALCAQAELYDRMAAEFPKVRPTCSTSINSNAYGHKNFTGHLFCAPL